jgi:hypothetical protein
VSGWAVACKTRSVTTDPLISHVSDTFDRLPRWMRFLAWLPQPDPRNPGDKTWSGVVRLSQACLLRRGELQRDVVGVAELQDVGRADVLDRFVFDPELVEMCCGVI